LDLFSASDPYVRFAAAVAFGAAVLTVLLVLQIIVLRELRAARERRRQLFLQRWRPLVYDAMAGGTVSWPRVARRDAETLLWFWNQLQETVRGDAKTALTHVAAQIGLDELALRRLRGRSIARRLLAIVTLGNMRDPKYWHLVVPLAQDAHAPVSLAAAQALIRINGQRAVRDLMPLFAQRADWPVTRALALLEQVEPAVVTKAIEKALPKADDAASLRLIEFVAAGDSVALQSVMVQRLGHSRDPQMWANVLRHVNDPAHLGLVRQACVHPVWFVRVQAANALGRMGGPDDVARLLRLLGDEQWWVRYRTAEALLKLPFLKKDELYARVREAGPAALAVLEHVAAREAA
jgi:HEAT repeat protein